ncbi:hypothetical protein JCM21714_2914 [Gracilibacillus boraciitolerans JCM 21714]|uniref:Uncharacterized protein n=1 Tax=Gracilibacillus boraciitolerans JCM 21714 TaxID=1298598 RepID=W4VKR0_9BACI|nr:hypothetical protein [Gracilibacillus boraciitolerans]GAE93807.1 hypothetical protein JCM21714_2914 [Gracilibacillus boraciitolerans JCM 21714]
MQYLTINLPELQSLATFKTTKEMDEVIYQYIDILRTNNEPTSVIDTLLFLGRSSLRITGVSFARYEKIGNVIGKSKRTVIRIMNVLAGYNMIEKLPTTKTWYGKSRKKSVNIIQILPEAIPQMSPQHVTTETTEEVTQDNGKTDETVSEPINYKHFINNSINTYSTCASRSLTPYVVYVNLKVNHIVN